MEDESSRGRVQGQEVHKPRIEHLSGFSDGSARGRRVRDSRLDKLSKLSEQQMDNQAIKQFYKQYPVETRKVGVNTNQDFPRKSVPPSYMYSITGTEYIGGQRT